MAVLTHALMWPHMHKHVCININFCTNAHKQCTNITRAPLPSNQQADLVQCRLQAACEFFAQEERPGPGGTP